ncbi:methyltransferase domain-containing protein [Lentimicrobium sp.]|uniref:class I SAM-dependent methyltransferase n=1 Tax=Lentimicrobium sp. TaxID=2034841 RepID=UPI0025EE2D40|nr:methyltransferase domain-containing protein [Lentimicrobium sp.]MCO5256054.1 methyltransferase domain-containing protein [Lentimicrobium sp.]MCO5262249.1 methyltransferase domain-containing protein [Lentimicrobium sp.]HOP14202.1 methyltransferase domain-containing protein [Lentimicrobium sp.]HPF63791.1 methyltransferase domain-containing protein [Lentimicrobium sp.]HPJ61467.1 methyltransferase domain-containing protein [Lentimicrobium sp.]
MLQYVLNRPEIRYHETYSYEGKVCSKRRSTIYRQVLRRVGHNKSGILLELTPGEKLRNSVLANINIFDATLSDYLPRLFNLISIETGFGRDSKKQRLPWEDCSFDAIICVDAFSAFQDPGLCLGELRRVLQPGGRLVLADQWFRQPNPLTDNLLSSYAEGYPNRIYQFNTVANLLRDAGFSTVTLESAGSNNYICTAIVS